MTSKDALLSALNRTGHTQESAAKLVGWVGQQISQRLQRNSMRADEFLTLMDAIGVDVTFTVRATGEVLKDHKAGYGRRVKATVDKVLYDTAASNALANSFYENGVDEYDKNGEASELYVDKKGRYFMAEYHQDGDDKLRPVSASVAAAFVEKYGTDIEKGPKSE
jgi:transcriptional regulator